MELVGICISYQYMDTLQFMLPVNHMHFKCIYIITQPDDEATIQFCKQFNNVKVLFFNFKNNNKKFDKYGGLDVAQSIAYQEHPESWYLIIDSDIILPQNFKSLLTSISLNPECIYGCLRINCTKSSQIKNLNLNDIKKYPFNNIIYLKQYPPSIIGYFQLYKKKVFHLVNLPNAEKGDLEFGHNNFNLFSNLNIVCIHLGESCKNWNGKMVCFDVDLNVPLEHFLFTSQVQPIYYNKQRKLIK
jgi:hypothetical protein